MPVASRASTARKCPLCESTSNHFRYRKWGYNIVQCDACGMVFVATLEARDLAFQAEDPGALTNVYLPFESSNRARAERNLEHLVRLAPPPGRLLDVGCGVAYFLQAAGMRGFQALGIDVNEPMAEYSRVQLGVHVLTGDFTPDASIQGPFDVLTMWEVIEHVSEPRKHLELACELLAQGGLLALSTPNIDNPAVWLGGARWRGFEPTVHLNYFSVRTIHRLLRECGFRVIDLWTRDVDVLALKSFREPVAEESLVGSSHTEDVKFVNDMRGSRFMRFARACINGTLYRTRMRIGDDVIVFARKLQPA